MDNILKARIEKIKPYFLSCAMDENGFVVKVQFTDGWKIPNPEKVMKKYGVNFVPKEKHCFFGVGADMDYDAIFNCIDFIIKYNRDNEEKINILNGLHKQLDELFTKEKSLDRLKRVAIVIDNETVKYDNVTVKDKQVDQESAATINTNVIISDDVEMDGENEVNIAGNAEGVTALTISPKRGPKKGNSLVSKVKKVINEDKEA